MVGGLGASDEWGKLAVAEVHFREAPIPPPPVPEGDGFFSEDENSGPLPAYNTTPGDGKTSEKMRQTVAHMAELKSQESAFLNCLLATHHNPDVLSPCACGRALARKVKCDDCLHGVLLCPQCWVDAHRANPTHWALVWNTNERYFERYDFCRVLGSASVALGHNGRRCPAADAAKSFTLVDTNGIHATAISFCRCKTGDGQNPKPEFEQLLSAGIFPATVKQPKTGYTLNLLEYYRELRNQSKISAYSFILVLQRLADPWFSDAVPDIYTNFLAITRFHQTLDIIMRRGYAHDVDIPLDGETERPYPNRPIGYLGLQCVACPERGVNMPRIVNVPNYLRHTISAFKTLDGNFKANQFTKLDMLVGEAFALGTLALRESLKRTNSPPHDKESTTPEVFSYDSWCSFVVKLRRRAIEMFPEETWLHDLLAKIEGQIPADHINGHGEECRTIWQAVYFACRAHFYGKTAEVIWAFLNPLGSSTRQSTGAARHDIMNFVIDAWNTWKMLHAARLLADERRDALRLFELHMAVLEDLSRQHLDNVVEWSRLSRIATKTPDGQWHSVYQHESKTVVTIESMLSTLMAEEEQTLSQVDERQPRTPVAQWIHKGIMIEREQLLTVAMLGNYRSHPLQDTWDAIVKLRESTNANLKKFREQQRLVYPRLKLSALDPDEPELTAIQLPSYRIKHGQREASNEGGTAEDQQLRAAEIQLRCGQANSGILQVQQASLGLSAVKKARDQDYRGQAGITRTKRNLQKAELLKTFEITMYNRARTALVHLGYQDHGSDTPYRLLTASDTWRKDTHLHRATGDSRLFDGTAWHLQSGTTISTVASALSSAHKRDSDDDDEPQLVASTQMLKRRAGAGSSRATKRLKDIVPEDIVVLSDAESSDEEITASSPVKGTAKKKTKKKKRDGWIWSGFATHRQDVSDESLAKYKAESDRVQWFRAEAEMYRWLEQYERKHAEFLRVIQRFGRDSDVWTGLSQREEDRAGTFNGKAAFARMQAAMYKRLQHNAEVMFKDANSGAHNDWVKSETLEELVGKIDGWRDSVFKWMDDMDIHRAYKDL
ncbi:CxC2 domain-containing protein [Favolaschia claudopus]|uniref:CxC2 domain-containing protein n=1 Tax=Favolaschia claudopus TaxID=2862362 RepID=A0AAV9ZB22_9AGAR